LNVPVVALSQLSREVEKREDKRPMLSDLRDSGSIEQDADVVMFVYREEYYLSRQPPRQKPGEKADNFADRMVDWESALRACANVADIYVEKQRNGPIGHVKCFFDGAKSIFGNLEQEEFAL
jgi:replicative DNA helicase